ncbi:hypothetical protein L195_g028196 [Trifolium pratense]|uniref:Uncharacterized protein n=1 Tax=Trifolium pratense TaxID=57577 RepID=A0A2K3L1C3_TRIPR|nr:hypothetical protein L195_g028196 [Trifolium pratense]
MTQISYATRPYRTCGVGARSSRGAEARFAHVIRLRESRGVEAHVAYVTVSSYKMRGRPRLSCDELDV